MSTESIKIDPDINLPLFIESIRANVSVNRSENNAYIDPEYSSFDFGISFKMTGKGEFHA